MKVEEFFFRLSPERVLHAIEAVGLQPTGHCFALNALENRVYDVRITSPESGDEHHVVAKFYRPMRWSREAILEEHALLAALRAAEIPVCAPLESPSGATLHEIEDIHYAVWPRTGGRAPDELDDEQVAVLGRLLARIHNVGDALAVSHRPRLDSEHVPLAALHRLEQGGFLPPSCLSRYRAAVLEVAHLYDEWSQGIAVHAIHGDCHVGNLLRGDLGFFFLDFDDMTIGPAVQDVWMLLPGRDDYAARQRALLVEAYRQFRDFDERSLRLIEPLRAFRFIFYADWIARRWQDPAFPDAFPHFGTEEYWERETHDLEDQVELIARGSGGEAAPEAQVRGASHDSDAELTNEDFFWDL